jgi:hypothetical protein
VKVSSSDRKYCEIHENHDFVRLKKHQKLKCNVMKCNGSRCHCVILVCKIVLL